MRVVRLFAGASVEGDRGPLGEPAAQRHRLALLALLPGHHPRPVIRDKLVAWLWPERDTPRARNLLSQAVHALRNALGAGAIQASGDEFHLDPDVVRTDVIEFQEACTGQDWKARRGPAPFYRTNPAHRGTATPLHRRAGPRRFGRTAPRAPDGGIGPASR